MLLGLVGGVVLAAAAGARRTDTAYPRMLRWANAAQVDVIPGSSELAAAYFVAPGKLPQVASMSTVGLYQAALPARRGRQLVAAETMSSPDGAAGLPSVLARRAA